MRFAIAVFVCLSTAAAPAGAQARPAGQHTIKAALTRAANRPTAPAFHLRDGAGNVVSLDAFRGRPVVLNLWATDCGGCKLELPTFVDLYRGEQSHGFQVVGVSMDIMYEGLKSASEGWARVTPFARSHGLGYTILLDDGSVEKAYKVTALPATYLIDKRGRLAATYVGIVNPANLTANVRALLAESASR